MCDRSAVDWRIWVAFGLAVAAIGAAFAGKFLLWLFGVGMLILATGLGLTAGVFVLVFQIESEFANYSACLGKTQCSTYSIDNHFIALKTVVGIAMSAAATYLYWLNDVSLYAWVVALSLAIATLLSLWIFLGQFDDCRAAEPQPDPGPIY